jgi:sugar lactone lactonase YvrE
MPPMHMIGAVTSTVDAIWTSNWIWRTSLVVRVNSDGAPYRLVSCAEKVVTCWNIAQRRSRPNPIPVREPK